MKKKRLRRVDTKITEKKETKKEKQSIKSNKSDIKINIKKHISHIRQEVNYIRNLFDDKEKFKSYLYYLHSLFSKLEILMIELERTGSE